MIPLRFALPLVAMISAPAFAGDASKDLPGVEKTYSIVKPSPAAEPEAVKADEDGFFMVGNTRVKISGLLRYDVDFSTANKKAPRIDRPD